VALLPVALFLSGPAIAPALIVGYGLADRLTDRAVHFEAGALVSTANNLGASIGTAATALVLDQVGAAAAVLVAAAAALVAMSLSKRSREPKRRWTGRTPARRPCPTIPHGGRPDRVPEESCCR
jgi:predicted MFS family arabinose efflux permease